jgi:hypothetical protein
MPSVNVRRLLTRLVAARRSLAATAAFAALAAGFWMAWRPLGLIVPGAIVFGALVWSHYRGGEE